MKKPAEKRKKETGIPYRARETVTVEKANRGELNSIVQQMADAQDAIASLHAMGITVLGLVVASGRPVIRVARNAACLRMISRGEAVYFSTGSDSTGRFRQGTFQLHQCRVVWSEALH